MRVFDLLGDIKKRPSMYVGGSDADRREQLRSVELLLPGYSLAKKYHTIDDEIDFPTEFGAYLLNRFGWSASAGPVAAVLDATENDEDAWQRFWVLVEEFRIEKTGS